jgi:phosphonate transport system substrate-binding protein
MLKKNSFSLLFFSLFFLSVSAYSRTITFGITPWQKGQKIDDIKNLYRPMLKYLSEKTGDNYLIVRASSYKKMIELLANGKVDFATVSPVPYVKAKKLNPKISIIVTYLKWNKDQTKMIDSYRGYIVTKKTRDDLDSIESLKNKKFGFVKKESSSGYKYPNSLLLERGINYKDYFSQVYFLGSHPRVTDAIIAGSIDAGATWDFNLSQAIKKHGDLFKIIFTTPPIPNLCIAASESFPLEKIKEIKHHLTNIPTRYLKGLPATGFVYRKDNFYDVVRKLKD